MGELSAADRGEARCARRLIATLRGSSGEGECGAGVTRSRGASCPDPSRHDMPRFVGCPQASRAGSETRRSIVVCSCGLRQELPTSSSDWPLTGESVGDGLRRTVGFKWTSSAASASGPNCCDCVQNLSLSQFRVAVVSGVLMHRSRWGVLLAATLCSAEFEPNESSTPIDRKYDRVDIDNVSKACSSRVPRRYIQIGAARDFDVEQSTNDRLCVCEAGSSGVGQGGHP